MVRWIAPLVAIGLVSGCRAPTPSFDMLAPYGSTRIAPPGTGSYGSPDSYYPNPARPSATAPIGSGLQSQKTGASPSASASTSVQLVAAASGSAAENASHEEVTTAGFQSSTKLVSKNSLVSSEPRIRVIERGPQLEPSEPAEFKASPEAIDISQLPRPRRPVVATMSAPPTTTRSAPAKTEESEPRKSASSGGWKSRDSLSDSPRIANR